MQRVDHLAGLLCFLVLMVAAPESRADAFRCGVNIIREGMRSSEIQEKCGEPDLVKIEEEPVFARLENGTNVQVGVTTTRFWYYDRGPNRFIARLAIRDSLAEEIDLLEVRDIDSLSEE